MSGSQTILEELERGNLFVIPLDDRRELVSLSPSLRGRAARPHLLDELPEMAPVLHGRAADWYEQNGMRADAVRHALAAEDFERAAALVELAWPEMDGTFQPSTWLRWKLALPETSVAARRPILQAAHAWALLDGGEMEAGEAQLRRGGVVCLELPPDELVVVDAEQFRTLPASIADGARLPCAGVGRRRSHDSSRSTRARPPARGRPRATRSGWRR